MFIVLGHIKLQVHWIVSFAKLHNFELRPNTTGIVFRTQGTSLRSLGVPVDDKQLKLAIASVYVLSPHQDFL